MKVIGLKIKCKARGSLKELVRVYLKSMRLKMVKCLQDREKNKLFLTVS
jgi:hypothetical protein